MRPAIGFDLDMTLVDTRPGIHAALVALAAETGRRIDADRVVAALGPPIQGVLSEWFGPDEIDEAVTTFRRHMAAVGVQGVAALPGASDAVAAVRAADLRVVVVTSKIEPLAVATLRNAALDVDVVHGGVWAEGKSEPLRIEGALAFVGDHPADMVAAGRAGVPGFGVTSGASAREDLLAAGAGEVAASLAAFPAWLESVLAGQPSAT